MHDQPSLTRRQFTAALAGTALSSGLILRQATAASEAPRLTAIVHQGVLVADSPLPGETRADGVVPAHPNGIQLAADRYLLLYATRGFRGIDDDRSICYQLRRGGFDGPLIREGFLSRSIDDWDPLGEGKRWFKQHGHPVAFGVPKAARIAGKVPAHANHFVAKWRTRAVAVDAKSKLVADNSRVAQGVEWMQFRLNDDESDIQVLQPPATLRQKGFETGELICPAPKYGWMNQTFVNAVSFNDDSSQWIDANHFNGGRVAALRYAFNPQRGLYEWVQTGKYLIDPLGGISEASVIRWGQEWLIGVRLAGAPIDKPNRPKRPAHGVGWLRTLDPFSGEGLLAFPPLPNCQRGRTAYRCADGVLRVFSGDATIPPNNQKPRNGRNPIYAWDIDPDRDWAVSAPRLIFDAWRTPAAIRPDSVPMCDMIKLLPASAAAPTSQLLVHRLTFSPLTFPPSDGEMGACGVYCARLEFDAPVMPAWRFD